MTDRNVMYAWMISAVTVGFCLVFVVHFFSGMHANNELVLEYVSSNADRLQALETNKSSATAKRFTSEHAKELMDCLTIPYQERVLCMNRLRDKLD